MTDETDDAFVPDLIGDLVAGGYSRAAFRTFWARAWRRSWTNIRARPRRRQATHRWIAVGMVCCVAILAAGSASVGAWVVAVGWFGLLSAWTYLHQGLIRSEDGIPWDRFLIPNGLSYLRLALAPLVAAPLLSMPHHGAAQVAMVTFAAFIVVSDQLDGFIARRFDQRSRLGRMLDPLADLAILSWMAVGLYHRELIDTPMLALLMVRFPGAFIGAIVMTMRRGPAPIEAGIGGKITVWVTAVAFLVATFQLVLAPAANTAWLETLMVGVAIVVAVGIVEVSWRAWHWPRTEARGRQS